MRQKESVSIPLVPGEHNLSFRLSDQIYGILSNAIISWKIKPGEKLLQEKLAREFGVSQLTIREALQRLTANGLTIHEPYRGTRVISLSPDDLIDIYEVRYRLEGYAMELAAAHITPRELKEMRKLLPLSAIEISTFPDSAQASRESNHKFHWTAIQACGRPQLCYHLSLVWTKIDPYLIYNPWLHSKLTPEDIFKDSQYDLEVHHSLLEALEAHDGEKTRKITETFIKRSLGWYQHLMSLAETTG
jgi:DNA-binding GntR family transcriptional regulator